MENYTRYAWWKPQSKNFEFKPRHCTTLQQGMMSLATKRFQWKQFKFMWARFSKDALGRVISILKELNKSTSQPATSKWPRENRVHIQYQEGKPDMSHECMCYFGTIFLKNTSLTIQWAILKWQRWAHLTSVSKSILRIRSASSITRYFRALRLKPFVFSRWSIRRPGVATKRKVCYKGSLFIHLFISHLYYFLQTTQGGE